MRESGSEESGGQQGTLTGQELDARSVVHHPERVCSSLSVGRRGRAVFLCEL